MSRYVTPLHEPALVAIQTAHQVERSLWISRQVIREYLVTMTRPQTFENLPKATLLEQINQFIKCFQVADGTKTVTGHLMKLMGDFKIGGKQVHDANIVATMLAYDIPCLLTHNVKDYERFGELIRIEGVDH